MLENWTDDTSGDSENFTNFCYNKKFRLDCFIKWHNKINLLVESADLYLQYSTQQIAELLEVHADVVQSFAPLDIGFDSALLEQVGGLILVSIAF